MTLPHSDALFIRAYPAETSEAFCDGHVSAFAIFGGVPQARGLFLSGMRAARLTTGITGTLYTSAQNEERPEAEPRFLVFSDSVQGAAHRAAVAETRKTLSVYQKSLFTALRETEAAGMSLREVIEGVPEAFLDTLGGDAFTALIIPKEQTWRRRYQDLILDEISITVNRAGFSGGSNS